MHERSPLVARLLGLATEGVPDPKAEFRAKPISCWEREEPRFLWKKWLRLGQLNLVEARQGGGKTTFLLAVALHCERGEFPWQEGAATSGRSLYIGAEDSPGELRSVYEDLGGNPDFLLYLEPWTLDDEGFRRLEAYLDVEKPVFVVLDPVMATWPKGSSEIDNVFLSSFLGRLRSIAMARGICIVVVRHFTKSIAGKHFTEYGGGGVQWTAIARTQLVLLPLPSRKFRFVGIFPGRGSVRSDPGEPFGYQFPRGSFEWIHPDDLPVSEFAEYYSIDDQKLEGAKGSKEPSMADQLEEFLREALAGGSRYEDELKTEAAGKGLKPEGKPWRTARERVVGNNYDLEGFGDRKRVRWSAAGSQAPPPSWAGLEDGYNPFADD